MLNRTAQDICDGVAQAAGPYATGSPSVAPPACATLPGRLSRVLVLALGDVLAFAIALGIASSVVGSADRHAIAVAAACGFVAIMAVGLADLRYRQRPALLGQAQHLLAGGVGGLAVSGFVAFWFAQPTPRVPLLVVWLLFAPLAMLLRLLCRRALQDTGLWQHRVIIVGAGRPADRVSGVLRADPRLGYEVVAMVDPAQISALGLDGRTLALRGMLARYHAHKLIVVYDPARWPQRDLVQSLLRARLPFAVVPEIDGRPVIGCDRTSFFSHDLVLIGYRNNLAQPLPRLAKLVFDVCVAGLLLAFIAPVFIAIAVLVKLDGGPAFYAQRRIGANGRMFSCYKFRSMVPQAEDVLLRLLDSDSDAAAEWHAAQKLRQDPRITRIGRILRATSLDELPQLLNVLRLEMSLVGPRPIVAAEAARYAEDIAFYHETRPGLTGLWQVSGRSGTSYDRRVELDCWYVKNWSIWHDLAILLKTIPAVMQRSGAV